MTRPSTDHREADLTQENLDFIAPLVRASRLVFFAGGLSYSMLYTAIPQPTQDRTIYAAQYDPVTYCIMLLTILIELQNLLPSVIRMWTHNSNIIDRGSFSFLVGALQMGLRHMTAICCGAYVGTLLWPIDVKCVENIRYCLGWDTLIYCLVLFVPVPILYACPQWFEEDADMLIIARASQSCKRHDPLPLGQEGDYSTILGRYRSFQRCVMVATCIPVIHATKLAYRLSGCNYTDLRPISFANPFAYCFILVAVISFSEQWRKSFCRLWVLAKIRRGMLWRTVFFARVFTFLTCGIAFHHILLAVYRLEEVDIYGFSANTKIWLLLVTAVLNLFCAYRARCLDGLYFEDWYERSCTVP